MSERQPISECAACLREDKKKKADIYCFDCDEHMCEECHMYHKKNKVSLSHFVREIGSKSSEIDFAHILTQLTKCVIHRNEDIKYECKDHDVLCCNECAVISHRKCNELVSVIDECTSTFKTTGNDKDNRLDNLEQCISALSVQEKKRHESISNAKNRVQKQLEDFKSRIDSAYQALERKVIKETNENIEKTIKVCSSNQDKIQHLRNELLTLKQTAAAVGQTGESKHAYLFDRKLRKEINTLKYKIISLDETFGFSDIKLVENIKLDDLTQSISSCLEVKRVSPPLDLHTSSRSPILSENLQEYRQRKVALENELDYDNFGCPRYSAWAGKYIVVALQDQNVLIQFDAEKMVFISSYGFESYCCSMTTVDDTTVAVSLPETESIVLIGITNTHLEHKETILVNAAFHAISFNKSLGQLVCLSQTRRAIDFLNIHGEMEYSVPLTEAATSKLQSANGIVFNNDIERIYVSCTDLDMVIVLDKNGQSLGELAKGRNVPLRGPLGIDLDLESNVYVFCRGGRSVLQCDKDFNFLREIIHAENNLEYAYSMSFNADTSKLVISGQHGQGSVYLKVYSFK